MKRTISLALVLAFTCICLVSCISPKDFTIEDKLTNSSFYYCPYGTSYETIELYENGKGYWSYSDYGIFSSHDCEWEVKYSLFGTYLLIDGEEYVYDFDDDTLTRKRDEAVFSREN